MNTKADKTHEARTELKTVQYDLPAYWASYLINHDPSGIEYCEISTIKRFLADNELPFPVDCSEEAWFSSYNDANTGLGGEVLTYTFLI